MSATKAPVAERVAAFIREHDIPAEVIGRGPVATVRTVETSVDRDGTVRRDVVYLAPSFLVARRWLGY
jgi:hypothetical protein